MVRGNFDAFAECFVTPFFWGVEAVGVHFEAADGFEEGLLDVAADAHHFPSALHLGAEAWVNVAEFVEGPARNLRNDVVEGGFECGDGFPGDGVGDFVEGHAECNLGCDTGNGVAGCLAGEGGASAYTGVDFDDAVFTGFVVDGVLDVAAAFNFEGANAPECTGAKHLVVCIA